MRESGNGWSKRAPSNGSLKLADLNAAVDRARNYDTERVLRESAAYMAFLAAVPAPLRTDRRILRIAAMAAASQSCPMHPMDAARLRAEYDAIVASHGNSADVPMHEVRLPVESPPGAGRSHADAQAEADEVEGVPCRHYHGHRNCRLCAAGD